MSPVQTRSTTKAAGETGEREKDHVQSPKGVFEKITDMAGRLKISSGRATGTDHSRPVKQQPSTVSGKANVSVTEKQPSTVLGRTNLGSSTAGEDIASVNSTKSSKVDYAKIRPLLEQAGVVFTQRSIAKDAWTFFEQPKAVTADDVNKDFPGSTVFSFLDEATITKYVREIKTHMEATCSEAEWADLYKRVLFLHQDSYEGEYDQQSKRVWRRLEMACPHGVGPRPSRFSGELAERLLTQKRDAVYLITGHMMEPLMRGVLGQHVDMMPKTLAMAPYLTIEFKKPTGANRDWQTAENQLALEMVRTVFSNFAMHFNGLLASQLPLTEDAFSTVREYGAVAIRNTIGFYEMRPKLEIPATKPPGDQPHTIDEIFQSFELAKLWNADISTAFELKRVTEMVNEIHRFGLEKHGKRVKEDLEALIRRASSG